MKRYLFAFPLPNSSGEQAPFPQISAVFAGHSQISPETAAALDAHQSLHFEEGVLTNKADFFAAEQLIERQLQNGALGVYMEHSGAAWAASAWESALPDEPTLESWLNWIERDGVLYSLGMEVFGLPDLCAPLRLGASDELREALTAIADALFFEGLKTLPELQKEPDKLHGPDDPYHNPRGRFRLLKVIPWDPS
jgi:hypothetical protein